jgi:hypothetical protein
MANNGLEVRAFEVSRGGRCYVRFRWEWNRAG